MEIGRRERLEGEREREYKRTKGSKNRRTKEEIKEKFERALREKRLEF